MFRNILQPVLLLCIAALIGGCAQRQQMMMLSPYDEQDMTLKIKGQDAKDALDQSMKIEDLLVALEAPSAANLKARINMLLNSPSGKLAGLGGIQSRAALETALDTLNNATGNFAAPLTAFSVRGQIQESVGGESGFYYKPGETMHMWVQMITTVTQGPMVKSSAQMFRIEVPAGVARAELRTGIGGNVFPDFEVFAFPITSSMAGAFQYKLWAVGNAVSVTDYWIDPNITPPGADPVYVPGKKYHKGDTGIPAPIKSIFDPDPEACIDMMFVLDPALDVADGGALDNGELVPGTEPPWYCLGRCRNPPVVNTP